MKRAFVIIRVSKEDQLKGYGPDVQWFEDVLPNAPLLGLEVNEALRAMIQEEATGWEIATKLITMLTSSRIFELNFLRSSIITSRLGFEAMSLKLSLPKKN